jgi:hypothetical protein
VAIPPVVPAPVAPPPAPPRRAPLPAPAIPEAAEAPATNHAVIVFANIPGSDCGACETVKISVTPGGQVLIEHSFAAADKRYKRQMARVSPARAAALPRGWPPIAARRPRLMPMPSPAPPPPRARMA